MTHSRQRGATMIVSLIFLILMTLFAISSFNTTSSNLRVVGNTQVRQEGIAAAQVALEQTISSTQFSTNPDAVAANPIQIDIDGNGSVDYIAQMTPKPKCYRAQALKVTDLDPTNAQDLSCMRSGVVQSSGLDSADSASTAGDSLCANSEWRIRAEVTDARTGATVAVNQGVAVRALVSDTAVCQ